jgi:hypothetical protein
MSDHVEKMIEAAQIKLREQESAVIETKKFINQVCQFSNRPPIYLDTDLQASGQPAVASTEIARNAYYGLPLATCVKSMLKSRENLSPREISLNLIMENLKKGCFNLEGITRDLDGQKRGVAISLAKNTTAFHKLPNGDWGLTEWYPTIRSKKEKSGGGKSSPPPADILDVAQDSDGEEARDIDADADLEILPHHDDEIPDLDETPEPPTDY